MRRFVDSVRLHIIGERDVGLFSLIQQVIANIPWAIAENRVPVVRFGNGTCYWTPNGYRERIPSGSTTSSLWIQGGEAAGQGPTGWIMPAYIATNRDVAAKNGEDAVIEYLLLSRCNYLVHNGSSLARTVLLNAPDLEHTNTHRRVPQLVAPRTSLKHRDDIRPESRSS